MQLQLTILEPKGMLVQEADFSEKWSRRRHTVATVHGATFSYHVTEL